MSPKSIYKASRQVSVSINSPISKKRPDSPDILGSLAINIDPQNPFFASLCPA
jgi:hypothetical protein